MHMKHYRHRNMISKTRVPPCDGVAVARNKYTSNCILTFERSDSGDSSMWRSSELSISSSIPVILPARLGCMFWIRGNRRSPAGRKTIINNHLD